MIKNAYQLVRLINQGEIKATLESVDKYDLANSIESLHTALLLTPAGNKMIIIGILKLLNKKESIEVLITTLMDSDKKIRKASADALDVLGENKWKNLVRGKSRDFDLISLHDDDRLVPSFLRGLGDSNKKVRNKSATTLSKYEHNQWISIVEGKSNDFSKLIELDTELEIYTLLKMLEYKYVFNTSQNLEMNNKLLQLLMNSQYKYASQCHQIYLYFIIRQYLKGSYYLYEFIVANMAMLLNYKEASVSEFYLDCLTDEFYINNLNSENVKLFILLQAIPRNVTDPNKALKYVKYMKKYKLGTDLHDFLKTTVKTTDFDQIVELKRIYCSLKNNSDYDPLTSYVFTLFQLLVHINDANEVLEKTYEAAIELLNSKNINLRYLGNLVIRLNGIKEAKKALEAKVESDENFTNAIEVTISILNTSVKEKDDMSSTSDTEDDFLNSLCYGNLEERNERIGVLLELAKSGKSKALNIIEKSIKTLAGKDNIEFYIPEGSFGVSLEEAKAALIRLADEKILLDDIIKTQQLIIHTGPIQKIIAEKLKSISEESLRIYQLLGVQMQIYITLSQLNR